MDSPLGPGRGIRARGAVANPPNRFERISIHADPEFVEWQLQAEPDAPELAGPRTEFFLDPSRQVLSFNSSPDLPFAASLNPYRGCEHGCSYCYARPTHEYLGFSAGLDFETKVLVKRDAPALLRRALAARSWKPQVVAIGGVTDPYQPVERQLGITRRCLEVFAEFRNPAAIVTKSGGVTRDLDLLQELARYDAAAVYVSITTLDRELHRVMEPRAAAPERRLATVEALARAGIPVGVLLAPVIPGLTDHEIPAIVAASAAAGARFVTHIMLRLPHGLRELFEDWLERHFPERKAKVLNRIRAVRGGRLNDARFHSRQRGSGPFADQVEAMLRLACRRAGLSDSCPSLSTNAFRRPPDLESTPQLSLFGRA